MKQRKWDGKTKARAVLEGINGRKVALTQMHQFFSRHSENAPEKYRWKALHFREKVQYNASFEQLGLPLLSYT